MEKKEKDEPRLDVVITGKAVDTFIKMVDEPVFDPKMAKLMQEANEAFPDLDEPIEDDTDL